MNPYPYKVEWQAQGGQDSRWHTHCCFATRVQANAAVRNLRHSFQEHGAKSETLIRITKAKAIKT